jgi:hypothetical protein
MDPLSKSSLILMPRRTHSQHIISKTETSNSTKRENKPFLIFENHFLSPPQDKGWSFRSSTFLTGEKSGPRKCLIQMNIRRRSSVALQLKRSTFQEFTNNAYKDPPSTCFENRPPTPQKGKINNFLFLKTNLFSQRKRTTKYVVIWSFFATAK